MPKDRVHVPPPMQYYTTAHANVNSFLWIGHPRLANGQCEWRAPNDDEPQRRLGCSLQISEHWRRVV